MNVLLQLEIIPFASVGADAQNILFSIELNGPALLTDSSMALMTTLTRERVRENPTSFVTTAERVLNWLFGKWTPRK